MITVIDSDKIVHTFSQVGDAIAYIREHSVGMFVVYAPTGVFNSILVGTTGEANKIDNEAIMGYRGWKGESTSWSDIEDLNDMMDSARKRIWDRNNWVTHGGESYPPGSGQAGEG